MRHALRLKILALVLLMLLPFAARAQELTAVPPTYTQQQIDQMTAPIALYPDQLVGQILMASTYPLEIVEASRWLQTPSNAQLAGDQLQAALAQQPWDPSVKSLVAFPQVLAMMDKNLQWTEQLGNAFLAQQAVVSDSIQRLRQQAQAAGNLQSTPQQTVTGQPGDLMIEPANPQVVYVPTYNPQVVYGAWPYPDYPPYYFPPPPGYIYTDVGPFAFFSTGVILADWFWGWDSWDWRGRHIDIDDRRFEALNRGRAPAFSGDVWAHDPAHRHGVPYASPTARAQFQPAADETRRNSRGFAPRAVQPPQPVQPPEPASGNFRRGSVTGGRANFNAPVQTPQPQAQTQTRTSQRTQFTPRAQPQVQTQSQQRTAPVFESFQHGSDVRAQSQRGAYSRSTRSAAAPLAAPVRQAAPAARPVNANAGGGAPRGNGGGQRGGGGRDGNQHDDHNR